MKQRPTKNFREVGNGGVGSKGKIHVTKSTQKLSARHHKENLSFNLRHAQDHLKEAAHSAKKVKRMGEKPQMPRQIPQLVRKISSM